MHPILKDADLEIRRAFLSACSDIAEQIYKQATPENFVSLVNMALDQWISEHGEKVMAYTPKMRDILLTVVLDALTPAFGFDASELPPTPQISNFTH